MKAISSELLIRNFNEIFIELDPLKRAALLAESYTEDCLWIHPGGRIVGREGINEAATEIRKHFAEYRYTVTSEIQIMHNVATCRWGSGMPGQPFHYTGTDFLEERDGRVSRLYTFIDQKLFNSPE
jgi:ketosteroid isomerase-like protein